MRSSCASLLRLRKCNGGKPTYHIAESNEMRQTETTSNNTNRKLPVLPDITTRPPVNKQREAEHVIMWHVDFRGRGGFYQAALYAFVSAVLTIQYNDWLIESCLVCSNKTHLKPKIVQKVAGFAVVV